MIARQLRPPGSTVWSRNSVVDLLKRHDKLPSLRERRTRDKTARQIAAAATLVETARLKRQLIIDLVERFKRCGYSLERIAATLNEFGYPTSGGKAWSAARVYHFVRRHEAIERRIAGKLCRRSERYTWLKECVVCTAPFQARSFVAKYCGDKCRASRERQLRRAMRKRKSRMRLSHSHDALTI